MQDFDNFRIKNKEQLANVLEILSSDGENIDTYRDGGCREFAHALLSLLPDNSSRLLCGTKGSGYHYIVDAFGSTWDIGGPDAKTEYPKWYREAYPNDAAGSYRWKEETPFKGRHEVGSHLADTARLQISGAAMTGFDVGTLIIDNQAYRSRKAEVDQLWSTPFHQKLDKVPFELPSEELLQRAAKGHPFLGHYVDHMFECLGRKRTMSELQPKTPGREDFSR